MDLCLAVIFCGSKDKGCRSVWLKVPRQPELKSLITSYNLYKCPPQKEPLSFDSWSIVLDQLRMYKRQKTARFMIPGSTRSGRPLRSHYYRGFFKDFFPFVEWDLSPWNAPALLHGTTFLCCDGHGHVVGTHAGRDSSSWCSWLQLGFNRSDLQNSPFEWCDWGCFGRFDFPGEVSCFKNYCVSL